MSKRMNQEQNLRKILVGVILFHTPDKQTYAEYPLGSHIERSHVDSKEFRLWIVNQYRLRFRELLDAPVLKAALEEIEAEALFSSPEFEVYSRVAPDGPDTWLDLGGPDWNAVHVTPQGWSVKGQVTPKFRRTRNIKALPVPISGGSLAKLFDHINVASE